MFHTSGMKPIPRTVDLAHPLHKGVMPPQQMLLEIAGGMEEPAVIASRYDYTYSEFLALSETTWYRSQIVHFEAELRATGVTFSRKAAMLCEDLMEDVFKMAKVSTDPEYVLKAAQWTAKMGRLEPVKETAAVAGNAGGSAVFQISFGFSQPGAQPLTVDVQTVAQINADLGVDDVEYSSVAG